MKLVAEFLLMSIVCAWDVNGEEANSGLTRDSSTLVMESELSQPKITSSASMLYQSLERIQPSVDINTEWFKDCCQVSENELKECQQQVKKLTSAHFEQLNYLQKYTERLLNYAVEISKCRNETATIHSELEKYKMKLQELKGDSFPLPSKALCEKGVSEQILNKRLVHATVAGNTSLVNSYLECGADPNSTIHLAAHYGHTDIVELLLDRGADINLQRSHDKWTPLHSAVEYNHVNVVSLLLSWGAEANVRRRDQCTPLYQASSTGNVQIVQMLLDFSASPGLKCEDGSTPLHIAAKKNHMNVTSVLLEHGADVNATDRINQTALHVASKYNYTQIAKLLLEAGADVNAKQLENGFTPLHYAAYEGHLQMVRLLVNKGANVKQYSEADNKTTKDYALRKSHTQAASFASSKTPRDYASERGHKEIAQYLASVGG